MGLRKNRAFTLIEVLISSAILSAGIVVILQAFSFCAKSAALSEDFIKAVFLAKDTLEALEAEPPARPDPQAKTEEKKLYDKFTAHYTIAPYGKTSLYQCDLTILWKRSERDESVTVSTYLR